MVLTIVPKKWYSWNFEVYEGADLIAELSYSTWRERGELFLADAAWRIRREGVFKGTFSLDKDGACLAKAEQERAFSDSLTVTFAGRRFSLRRRSILRRERILEHQGMVVGHVRPTGWLSRKSEASFSVDLPVEVTIFVIWLVVLQWKKESEVSAANPGVG